MKGYKSVLIKDTTREEREEIVRRSLSCESGCENCSGCALGVGDPFEMYKPISKERKRSAISIAGSTQAMEST